MTVFNNINDISNLYRRPQAFGPSLASEGADESPSPMMPVDRVTLSTQALKKDSTISPVAGQPLREENLPPEARQQVSNLKKRDAEVKAHEQAHMASGGALVQGGASYEYQTGPDGKMYAVGGEVKIDLSPERTPEATIRKMQQVRRAALAPAEPSGADRAVAAQASQIEAQARAQKAQEDPEDDPLNNEPTDSASSPNKNFAPFSAYQSRGQVKGQSIDIFAA